MIHWVLIFHFYLRERNFDKTPINTSQNPENKTRDIQMMNMSAPLGHATRMRNRVFLERT
jgi:hemolysin-activating ACP:hemolysin acyltransferase